MNPTIDREEESLSVALKFKDSKKFLESSGETIEALDMPPAVYVTRFIEDVWPDYPTNYEVVSCEERLLKFQEIPEKHRQFVRAWSGMVSRAARKRVEGLAIIPVLAVYLTKDLLPLGWSRKEAFEEITFETRLNAKQITEGFNSLRHLLLSTENRKALEPLGWVLSGEWHPGAGWLALCWDDFLRPNIHKAAHDKEETERDPSKWEQKSQKGLKAHPVKDADPAGVNVSVGDTNSLWQELLAFMAGRAATNANIPTDHTSDGSPLRR